MTAMPVPSTRPDRKLVAPRWHTAVLVLIFLASAAAGASLQGRPAAGPDLVPEHRGIVLLYLSLMAMEWALVYYVWFGARQTGTRLRDLMGRRWTSWKTVLLDFAIAIPFWIVWEETAKFTHYLLGPGHAKSVRVLLPQGILEVGLWVALSITAGFCEELVFRGYLQKQFQALTGSAPAAVMAQAAVFGVAHGYQGTKQVIVITVLGVLYGLLAAWRKGLPPCMVAHAWSDVYEGFLKFKLG